MSGFSEAPRDLPPRGRLLGVDHGTRRLGLAVCNPEQTLALPLEVYPLGDSRRNARHLARVVQDYGIVGIVVGLPVHMSGAEGQRARSAKDFGNWASQVTGLPVDYVDERYSTAMAEELLARAGYTARQRRARRDMLAAQMILQAYLEGGRGAARLDDQPQA